MLYSPLIRLAGPLLYFLTKGDWIQLAKLNHDYLTPLLLLYFHKMSLLKYLNKFTVKPFEIYNDLFPLLSSCYQISLALVKTCAHPKAHKADIALTSVSIFRLHMYNQCTNLTWTRTVPSCNWNDQDNVNATLFVSDESVLVCLFSVISIDPTPFQGKWSSH